jgi:hypothetical protein
MGLDQELLRKARDAIARIDAAEREVHNARADYNTLVRRLHLAGASLREIARALAVSHQRVQQVVEAAGGTWWQRVWRTRNAKHELICTFCDEAPHESAKLVAGPDVFICDRCVTLAARACAHGRAGKEGTLVREGARSKRACSFCGHTRSPARQVVSGAAASVCADCLRLCEQILGDRRA